MEIIKNTGERIKARGATPCPRGWGRAYPMGAPPASWAPLCSTELNSNSIYSCSGKQSERRIHRVLRYGAAAKPYSLSGGLIWSPFGAPERGIRRRRNHQPSSITNFVVTPKFLFGFFQKKKISRELSLPNIFLYGKNFIWIHPRSAFDLGGSCFL